MHVSVVVCQHTTDRVPYLREAVESVLEGSYDDREVVIVSDGSPAVTARVEELYGDRSDVRIVELDENRGLLAARNAGAEAADGDVVAFLDDDAVADEEWLAELAAAYEHHDPPAVGGRMTPLWIAGRPAFLPAEFYWLIGVTHRGAPEGPGYVRNTNGSNLSFRREVFLDLGGFDTAIGGRKGDRNLQGGETELCARLREEYGRGVWYAPEAEVAHKVFHYRTRPKWLADRAFWQGYSKRGMEMLVPDSTGEEWGFLSQLLGEFLPDRLRGLVRSPSTAALLQLVALVALTACVGAGYAYGFTKYPPWIESESV
jgi:glycosyltransferase involved in cell wall biosynthesis